MIRPPGRKRSGRTSRIDQAAGTTRRRAAPSAGRSGDLPQRSCAQISLTGTFLAQPRPRRGVDNWDRGQATGIDEATVTVTRHVTIRTIETLIEALADLARSPPAASGTPAGRRSAVRPTRAAASARRAVPGVAQDEDPDRGGEAHVAARARRRSRPPARSAAGRGASAIARNALQNSGSSDTLVRCPRSVSECFSGRLIPPRIDARRAGCAPCPRAPPPEAARPWCGRT